mmetsp:Transcript_41091/g.60092  ORF Transcript_41091/g.60092 Transcript_41091/m.60092 type:complete len:169 (+) Transcript_41091:32-538(+)
MKKLFLQYIEESSIKIMLDTNITQNATATNLTPCLSSTNYKETNEHYSSQNPSGVLLSGGVGGSVRKDFVLSVTVETFICLICDAVKPSSAATIRFCAKPIFLTARSFAMASIFSISIIALQPLHSNRAASMSRQRNITVLDVPSKSERKVTGIESWNFPCFCFLLKA